jgi:hypothetical protein
MNTCDLKFDVLKESIKAFRGRGGGEAVGWDTTCVQGYLFYYQFMNEITIFIYYIYW